MMATKSTVQILFSPDFSYRVPAYARDYVWNESNWTYLWDDIQEHSNLRLEGGNKAKTHFTGTIVISEVHRADEKYLEIIDGQQRLTTFQIILCAIRDTCYTFNNAPKNIADAAQRLIQNGSAFVSGLNLYKLLPQEGIDRDAFQSLVAPEETEATEENDKSELILPAYKYFKNKIQGYVAGDYDKLRNLFVSILRDFTVVQIGVRSDEELEEIFQTINGIR